MREALIALVLLCCGCGLDAQGLGGAASVGGDDDGGGGDTSSGGGDATPDGGSGDPYPTGAISFFRRAACPSGWAPYEPANGRAVVPTIGATVPGGTNGEPLTSGEDRTHVHEWSVAFAISKFDFVGFGGDNKGVGGSGTLAVSGKTDPASSGIPYVQQLVCKKSGPQGAKKLPSGLLVHFDSGACPPGFRQSEETQGRLLVGLPKGAAADQTFGSASMWGSGDRLHTHDMTAALQTSSHGIALPSGCCADGYARNGTYTVTTATEPSGGSIPWIELLTCVKE
ncbi:MAG: hypothetical protein HYV09_23380 [Deltaproteobacteria bacterium]|nr:hypothetical protein [Deltaproteobacteria bacterium]